MTVLRIMRRMISFSIAVTVIFIAVQSSFKQGLHKEKHVLDSAIMQKMSKLNIPIDATHLYTRF